MEMIVDAGSLLTVLESATDLTGYEHDAGRVTVRFEHGVESSQRATMWAEPASVHLGMWVGELTPEFTRVYSHPRAVDSLVALGDNGWTLRANFHLAFHNSNWKQRWYPANRMPAADYLRQWTMDLPNAGRFPRHEIEDPNFTRWLVERGYITDAEEDDLAIWLRGLRRQQVDVRPSLAIERSWANLPAAADVRGAINEVLLALEEPILSVQRRAAPAAQAPATKARSTKAPATRKRVAPAERPVVLCPNCFVALPATGVCDCG